MWIKDGMSYNEQLDVLKKNAQQSVHLTALRRGLWVSICINIVMLLVVASTFGGR